MMIPHRPRRKETKPVKKKPNHSGSLVPGNAFPIYPLQRPPCDWNGHHSSTQSERLNAPFESVPPTNYLWAPSGSWPGPPCGPILAPRLPSAPARPGPLEKPTVDRLPSTSNQDPALYDLISSKLDAILTSIDEEMFSGDRRELGNNSVALRPMPWLIKI